MLNLKVQFIEFEAGVYAEKPLQSRIWILLDINSYQFVINKNMTLTEYQMSHNGAAGKAFSAQIPAIIKGRSVVRTDYAI